MDMSICYGHIKKRKYNFGFRMFFCLLVSLYLLITIRYYLLPFLIDATIISVFFSCIINGPHAFILIHLIHILKGRCSADDTTRYFCWRRCYSSTLVNYGISTSGGMVLEAVSSLGSTSRVRWMMLDIEDSPRNAAT